jgi:hypothetical protein
MGFDPYYHSLKVQKSIGTPTPKMGVHLGVWGFILSHSPTLLGTQDVTPRLPSWLAPLQNLALVASPKLGWRHLAISLNLMTFVLEWVVFSTSCLIWAMTSTTSWRILRVFSKPIKKNSHLSFISLIKCTWILPFSFVKNLWVKEPMFFLLWKVNNFEHSF